MDGFTTLNSVVVENWFEDHILEIDTRIENPLKPWIPKLGIKRKKLDGQIYLVKDPNPSLDDSLEVKDLNFRIKSFSFFSQKRSELVLMSRYIQITDKEKQRLEKEDYKRRAHLTLILLFIMLFGFIFSSMCLWLCFNNFLKTKNLIQGLKDYENDPPEMLTYQFDNEESVRLS